jgi:hypothetical protein
MASHSQDKPHTLSTPKMSNSPQKVEEHFFPEIPYTLPHEELNQFKIITRAYARQIGALPLAMLLPHRKLVVDTPDKDFFHTVEDLIDLSLTEIEHPLNLIPETLVGNCFKHEDFFDEEGFNSERSVSESDDMEDNNDHNEERETHLRIINLGWPEMF